MVILEHGIAVSPDILISLKTRKGKTYLFYQGNDDFGKTWFLSNMEVKWKNRHPFIAHYINQKAH